MLIIGLTGTYDAGKGEIADYLAKKGYDYFSLSDEIRDVLMRRGKDANRENLITVGNEMRAKFGPAYWAERVIRKIKKSCVVDSIRNPAEVEALRKKGDFILIAVDAPIELRFKRSKERERIDDGMTLQQFVDNEKREMSPDSREQQLHLVAKMADHTIVNDSTLEELHKKVDRILEEV